ncbi:MAG: hypothetical protein ACLS37_13060, partial [Alistipes sp.]
MAGITLDELFSVARYRGIGEASFPFVSLQEYVLYAYAINRDFSAAGPVFTEAWTAPEIKVSTATATVVWSKYYDGEALYAYDPETYSDGQMNLAFIPTTIEHSDDAAEWYAAIYADDLTDRSDLSIINNLLKSGQKNPTTLSIRGLISTMSPIEAPRYSQPFCAVALDAGNYQASFPLVAMPLESGARHLRPGRQYDRVKTDKPVPFSSVTCRLPVKPQSTWRASAERAQAMNHKLFEPAAPREKDASLRHAGMRRRPGRCSACGCAERLHDVGMKRAPGFREPVVLPGIRLLRQVAGDGSRRTTRGCRATVFGPVAACRLRQRRKEPSQLVVLPQRSEAVTRSRCSSPVGRSRSSKVCVTMPRIGSR